MARETWVQSQIESYQRLKKWNLTPPCLTLSNIRYGSRVKWSNPWKGVAPSPTPWCSSYRKGSLRAISYYSHQLYFTYTYNSSITALSKFYRIWFATNSQSEIVTTNTVTIYIYIYIYIYIVEGILNFYACECNLCSSVYRLQ